MLPGAVTCDKFLRPVLLGRILCDLAADSICNAVVSYKIKLFQNFSDVNKDLTLKAKARTKGLTLKAKARTKDSSLKAKDRTKDLTLKAKARTKNSSLKAKDRTKDLLYAHT